MRELHLRTSGPSETRAVAGTIARALRPGDVVALTGELGAGKTCFVQGAASSLGVTERVTSPSFVLRREYRGRIPMIHLDIYRLETLSEVVDLGFEEIFDPDHVTFIEWGDAMTPLLPPDYLEVEFLLAEPPDSAGTGRPGVVSADGGEARTLIVRAHGGQWRQRLAALEGGLQPWDVQRLAADDIGHAPFRSPPRPDPEGGG